MNTITFDFEIRRKILHFSAVIFPLCYLFIPKLIMIAIIVIATVVTVYIDIYRHYNDTIKGLIDKFLGNFLRPEEENGKFALTGTSYMIFGMLITIILFPKGLAIASWCVLIVSDCFAAIVGLKFGSPLFNGKSYVGSATFFISSIVISILLYFLIHYQTSFIIIIISSLLTTLVEFFSKEIHLNDNLSIPLTYALSTTLLKLIL